MSSHYDPIATVSSREINDVRPGIEDFAAIEGAAEALREVEIEAAQYPGGSASDAEGDAVCKGSQWNDEAFSIRRPR